MRAEEHLAAYQEHREAIFNWALEVRGLERSQRIVGMHASRRIVELLSAVLHKKRLVDEGFQLNHRWFKSERVAEKLPNFKGKKAIVRDMVALENSSETLTYGAQKTTEKTKEVIELFKKLENEIRRIQ